ncbi:helix-turn-helix transcriptional regulator [Lactobacillus sp. YT155]|uniref:helix-turn-helix domain-containing protein n=1 Tax=Lactobacillus sp. YT155 TaxID=3060955 RepID=UPI00265EDD58|nr:helix-turn-helix transcriptional regulator [Lactobacillus sp. YT155]MDO1604790.1 helix-turn-helix transcriptional regulator [Lactobacillus sp. YT155]
MGNNLRFVRKENGLTLDQVSSDTGIPRANLSRYEKGISDPKIDTWVTLADYYHATLNWLAGLDSDENHLPYIENISDLAEKLSDNNNVEIRHTILSEDEYYILKNIHSLNKDQLKEIKDIVSKDVANH